MEEQIVNRVAASNLITFDLEELYPLGDRVLFDIKDLLYQGLMLKEKEFRDFVKTHDWPRYTAKHVAVTCTADAIIPTWAFMVVAVALRPFAGTVFFGTIEELESHLFSQKLDQVDWNKFREAKVVVKGCSKVNVPVSAYVEAVNHLQPIVSSLMFGEPCSTVPLFKRKKA
jgi:hypothetical protein